MFPEGMQFFGQRVEGFVVGVVHDSCLRCDVEESSALTFVNVSVQIYLETQDIFLN